MEVAKVLTRSMGEQSEIKGQAADVLDACLAAKVRAANRAAVAIFDRHLSKEATTSAQTTILLTVAASGPSSMSELASAAGIDLSSMQRSIGGLEANGLVRVEAGHARKKIVSITSQGEAKLQAVLPRWQAAQNEFAERLGFDPSEMEQLSKVLDAIRGLR